MGGAGVELIQRFPDLVAPLEEGKLCMSVVAELAKVLTPENRAEVLPRFFHVSRREAEEVVAELAPVPEPPLRTVVTILAAPSPERTVPPAELVPAVKDAPPPAAPQFALRPPDAVESLTATLSRIHVTVSRDFLRTLDAARDALSHSHKGASDEEILRVGLDLILARQAKRRGLVKKPRKTPAQDPSSSRYVPAAVRRAVFARDQGRCQEPLASGGICGSTYQVELHHLDPEGPSTVDNLSCRCKAHNLAAARKDHGDDLIDRYAPRRTPRPPPVAREPEVGWAVPPRSARASHFRRNGNGHFFAQRARRNRCATALRASGPIRPA